MADLKTMKRSALKNFLDKQTFKPGLFFATSIRATKDNSLQLEVCQARRLAGRKRSLLGLVNRSDKRFGNDSTLLFDWITFQPADMLATFPQIAKTHNIETLEKMAETYDASGPKGRDAAVFAAITKIPYIMDAQSDEKLTPIIAVTEVTETQLKNGEFYKGDDAEEKIENEIENGSAIMKTGSDDDADFIVCGETGDKVFRFTRTVFAEEFPNNDWDTIIPSKVTLTAFNKSASTRRANTNDGYTDIDNLEIPEIVGSDSL